MKVIVIGGGPAGCAAAYTLNKDGHDVEIFEAGDQFGDGLNNCIVMGLTWVPARYF